MDNIKKLNLLGGAKEIANKDGEGAEYVLKSLEADLDAVSSFIHMHAYDRHVKLLMK